MAKMHKGGAGSSKLNHAGIVRHCEKIAQHLRAAAQESDALAATLRESAKNSFSRLSNRSKTGDAQCY
jgi:hypothetical protein